MESRVKVQLLRNCGNSFHELADAHERRLYLPRLEMRGREAQQSFPSADDEPSYDAHVHWTRCRRFQVPVSVRQPAEDVPPFGHDGDEPCDCAARLQILRDESAPAVLVLVLVEIFPSHNLIASKYVFCYHSRMSKKVFPSGPTGPTVPTGPAAPPRRSPAGELAAWLAKYGLRLAGGRIVGRVG